MIKVTVKLEIDGEEATISSEGGAMGAIYALSAAMAAVRKAMEQREEGVRG